MFLLNESKNKIIKAYIGDLHWLDTIKEELTKYESEDKVDILKMIDTLYHLNWVVLETETEKYAEKYYTQAHELYAEMKVDLTEMLGIQDMWEEI